MKKIKIGLIGLNYASTNFGCAALSYSFLGILNEALKKAEKKADVTFFFSKNANVSINELPLRLYDTMSYRVILFDKRKIGKLISDFKQNDLYFDFTSGDSFSDIYGIDRFKKTTFMKSVVEILRKPLILGPQTYGPFKSRLSQKWAKIIFNNSKLIYARDYKSLERASQLTKKNINLVTDVAFSLEYDKKLYLDKFEDEIASKIKVGINMSGLLYSGGYTNNNQFGLKTDYKEYLEKLVDYFWNNKKYEIHIIPHAIAEDMEFPDNDLIPTEIFKKKYPDIKIAPIFKNPMEAKSYICHMDVFTGARMHATIGAFSSGVCCIPFSYSPKFEGLYGDLEYYRCINGKKLSTEIAVKKTIEYIENMKKLRDEQEKAINIANDRLNIFKDDIINFIKNY